MLSGGPGQFLAGGFVRTRPEAGAVLRVGVVGCGVAGRRHLDVLATVPGIEVGAVADLDGEAARRAVRGHGSAACCSSVGDLLSRPGLEAVCVCCPTRFHAEVAAEVLEAGRHLLLEKPVALTLEEADELGRRAEASGRVLLVGHNLRHHRLVRRARALVGQAGAPRLLRTILSGPQDPQAPAGHWRKRRSEGGGALLELGVHHFDLWRHLLDAEVEEVTALSRGGTGDDETVVVGARLASGALASTTLGMAASPVNELEVLGEAGRLRVDLLRFDGMERVAGNVPSGSLRHRLAGLAHAFQELPAWLAARRHGGDYVASYRNEWVHFLDCVRGGQAPRVGWRDGRAALAVALAALQSARESRPVPVDPGSP